MTTPKKPEWSLLHLSDLHFVHKKPKSEDKKFRSKLDKFKTGVSRHFHLAGHDPNTIFALSEFLDKNYPKNPPVTVLTGDFTTYGDEESMRQVKELLFTRRDEYTSSSGLSGLGLDPKITFSVPGNHDIEFLYNKLLRKIYIGSKYINNFNNFFGTHSFPHLINITRLSKNVTFRGKPVFCILLNSTIPDKGHFADGKIGNTTMNRLTKLFNTIHKDSFLIVIFHHNLIPVPGKDIEKETMLHDMATFSAFLCRRSDALVLNGHEHTFCLARLNFPHINKNSINIAVAGSATIDTDGKNNSFNLIHFFRDTIELHKMVYNRGSRSFDYREKYTL